MTGPTRYRLLSTFALPWVCLVLWLHAVAAHAAAPSTPKYGMELQEVAITLPDGVKLAADLYRPTGAPKNAKFPVLLEYLPYRKTEARAQLAAVLVLRAAWLRGRARRHPRHGQQ